MSRHENESKSGVMFIINQKSMTVFEFNELVKMLSHSLQGACSFLKFELIVVESFRLAGDIGLLSEMGKIYYKAFVRKGYIRNLKVIK